MSLGADLVIKAAIGLQKALIGKRAIEQHFAIRPDLGRSDHRRQHIIEPVIEIACDRLRQHAVERQPAAQQQDADPQRRDADHASTERPGRMDRGRGGWTGHYSCLMPTPFARACRRSSRQKRGLWRNQPGAEFEDLSGRARPGCNQDRVSS